MSFLRGKLLRIMTFRGQRDMGTYVIEVKQLKVEVIINLRGRLKVTMASETTRMTSDQLSLPRHRSIGPKPSCSL